MRTHVELFAGAGGLALGLEQAGFSSIALIENDHIACETLRLNRPNWNVIEQNIEEVAESNLLEILSISEGELDLLSGGYPCQSFSTSGKRLGLNDVRGTMFYYYADFLRKLEPKMFLAENVRGLVSHDKGRTLQTMIDVFESIGYRVQWSVLNAWDYSVAQKRPRIVIIGIRSDLSIDYKFPLPNLHKPVLSEILKDVPDSPGIEYSDNKKSVLDMVPPGGCWRDLPDDVARAYMKKSYFSGGGRTGIARRMSWDEPSLTLLCSPSMKQTDRCHPDETRPFTTREYARIQSFPDDWIFSGNVNDIYRQIGNAVPVEFARCLGTSIMTALENTEC